MVSRGQIIRVIEESLSSTNSYNQNQIDGFQNPKSLSSLELQAQNNKLNQNRKASFQAAKEERLQKVYKYAVRVPLLHGKAGEASSVPDSQLPIATFCPTPGSQTTRLTPGDIVYVAAVDFAFDDLVILGLVPESQKQSQSGLSLQRVQSLKLADNADVKLSGNIQFSSGDETISWDNLRSLSGFNNKLSEYVWPMSQGGTGISISGSDDTAKKKMRDNFGIASTKIIKLSQFEELERNNKLESNTIYYVYED